MSASEFATDDAIAAEVAELTEREFSTLDLTELNAADTSAAIALLDSIAQTPSTVSYGEDASCVVQLDPTLANPPSIIAFGTEAITVDASLLSTASTVPISAASGLVVTTNLDVVNANDGVTSLREAIEQAEPGATITFSPSMKGKTITLSGTQLEIAQALTIDASALYDAKNNAPGITINADGKSRVFYVDGGTEDAPVELIGLTITGGNTADDGGGVYVSNGTTTFTNCAISGNTATGSFSSGGGVYADSGTTTFMNCAISGNTADYDGGGVYASGTTTFTNCAISGNTADYDGGGVYASGTTTFTNCAISGNTASSGGGVYASGTTTFTNCAISGNTAGDSGGGVYADSDVTTTFTNSTISGNTASSGGGVYVSNGTTTFTNSTISGNTASSYGGGVRASGTTTFTNSTISGNTASYGGGVRASGTTTFTNSTISGNTVSSYGGGVYASRTTTLYNSIVALNIANDGADIYTRAQNAKVNAYNTLSSYSAWSEGTNNYVYDASLPLFTNAENGDYTLASGSQAIDKGKNQYGYDAGMTADSCDLAGERRFMGSTIDLGAYESFGLDASQRDVYVGAVELTLDEYPDATSGRVYWMAGAATTFIGTLAVGGTLLWDSTKFANGAGEIVCEYFDEKSVAVGKTASSGTIINDPGVVVKRGKIDADETWESDKVYVVVGALEIAANAKLTVAPSTVVKFWKNGYLNLAAGAKLVASAASIWTRAEDDSVGGDANQDGGKSTPKYGGAYWRGSGVDGATIDASAVVKYVATTCSGKLARSETWLGGQVYRISGDLTVPSGVTLTILPGAILKFDSGKSLIVEKGGKLTAQGTTAQPIVFTSINDDQYGGDTNGDDGETSPTGGDWDCVNVAGVATFSNVKFYYGAPYNESGILEVSFGGTINLDACVIAHAKYDGLWNWGGTINATNTIVSDVGLATAPYRGTQNYVNCVFNGTSYAAMFWSHWTGSGKYVNCVFSNIYNDWLDSLGSLAYQNYLTFQNCLFWNPKASGPQTFAEVGKNGNIWANPLFRDAANGDYRLSAGSPCIDAGDGTLAPTTDADGTPRVTDDYSARVGTPNADGNYVDIGAYEFADGAASSIDLTPIELVAPTNVSAGETITLEWTTRNNGSAPVANAWNDEIYLVSEFGREIYVATVANAGGLAPGDLTTKRAQVVVPNDVKDGVWRFAVRVNPNRDVFEGVNVDNNVLVAQHSTTFALRALVSNETIQLDAKAPSVLYRLEVEAGQAVFLRGTSEQNVAISLAEGRAPSSESNDCAAASDGSGNYALFVPASDVAKTYYLRVEAVGAATVELELSNETFALTQTTLASVSNAGASTVGFLGAGFDASLSAKLKLGDKIIDASEVAVASGSSASARFDLTGVVAGSYDLIVSDGAREATLEKALKVTENGVGAQLTAELSIPANVRVGRVYSGTLRYENNGDSDMFAPIIVISGGTPLGLSFDTVASSALYVVGVGSAESAGILRPGESGEITFYFKAEDETNVVYSTIGAADVDAGKYDSALWASWEEYYRDFSDAATRLSRRGVRTLEYAFVKRFVTTEKSGGDATGVSGILTETSTAEPLANVRLRAEWSDGETTRFDYAETDAAGRYIFDYLPANREVAISVLSGAYAPSVSTITTTDGDRTRVNFSASAFGKISGRILGADGRAVKDASVVLSDANGNEIRATTDRTGAYEFGELENGKYVVAVVCEGRFKAVEPLEATVVSGGAVVCPNLRADRGAGVAGTVTDADGAPIAGAFVIVACEDGVRLNAETDEAGRYCVEGLNCGSVEITVSADGCVNAVLNGDLTQGTTLFDATLAVGQTLSGRVVDKSGARVADVSLHLIDANDKYYMAIIDEAGNYRAEGLPVGTYRVRLYSATGTLNQETEISLQEGANVEKDFVWVDCARLSGRAFNETGQAVGGVTLILHQGDDMQIGVTDASGDYLFSDLAPGVYELSVVGLPQKWTISYDGTNAELVQDVELEQAGTISGVLKNAANEAVPYAEIMVVQDGVFLETLYTDAQGYVCVNFTKPGDYELYASSDCGIFAPQQARIEFGSAVELNMPLGEGAVRATCDGLTDASAVVYWQIARLNEKNEALETFSGESSSIEAFDASGLLAGKYKMVAYSGDYWAETTFETSADGAETSVDLQFAARPKLSVVATLPESATVALDETRACLYDSENNLLSVLYADENGAFSFALLPEGEYTLAVINERFIAITKVVVDETAETLELALQEATRVFTGTAFLNGKPAANATIIVTDENGVVVGLAVSNADGSFTVYAADAESYVVEIWADGAVEKAIVVEKARETNDLGEIALEEAAAKIVYATGTPAETVPPVQDDVVSNAAIIFGKERNEFTKRLNECEQKLAEFHAVVDPCECACTDMASVKAYNDELLATIKKVWEAEEKRQALEDAVNQYKADYASYCVSCVGAGAAAIGAVAAGTTAAVVAGVVGGIASVIGIFTSFNNVVSLVCNTVSTQATLGEVFMEQVLKRTVEPLLDEAKEAQKQLKSQPVVSLSEFSAKKQEIIELEKVAKATKIGTKYYSYLGKICTALSFFLDFKKVMESKERVFQAIGACDAAINNAEIPMGLGAVSKGWLYIRQEQLKVCECVDCDCNSLAAPSITVTGTTTSSISLSWTPVKNATKYYFEVSASPNFSSGVHTYYSTLTSTTVRGLQEDTTYYIRMKAVDATGKYKESVYGATSARTAKSEDPNEILGPIGFDFQTVDVGTPDEPFLVITTPNWIDGQAAATQHFTIYFENKPTATAAAQEVFVETTLSEAFDWSTFELGAISVGNEIYDEPVGCVDGVWTVEQKATGEQIQISVECDPATGAVKWYLRSYVASTPDHFPSDAYAGFLPPNDKEKGTGEGYVSFSVKLNDGLTSNTRIETSASIVFDVNEPIVTNTWVNTIDADAPTAEIADIKYDEEARAIAVSWNGEDVGSGIASYDAYYSTDGGKTFELWLSQTAETSGLFALPGIASEYVFKVVAFDGVGNASSGVTASITIESDDIIRWSESAYVVTEDCALRLSAEGSTGGELTYYWDLSGSETVDASNFTEGDATI